MGYALLWIESLAAALLLIAAATAYRALAPKQRLAKVLLVVAVAVPLVIGSAQTTGAVYLAYALIEHNWLTYNATWLVCLLTGGGLLLRRGLRRAEGVAAAARWPAVRLAVGFAIALALYFITFWNMDTSMRLKLSSVRLEAAAMSVAAAPPRPPDQENAALLYEKAFVLIKRINDEDPRRRNAYQAKSGKWSKDLSKRDYDTKDPELREFLKAQQATLAMLRRAAALQGYYFERDYALPSITLQMPEMARLRESARLLAADARCKAADGQVRASLEDIAAMQAISRQVAAEPIIISYLVSVAIDSMALDTLEGILTTALPSAADLAALPTDDTTSFQRALRRSLVGEEAFGLSWFTMMFNELTPADMQKYYTDKPDESLRPLDSLPLGALWRVYLMPDEMAGYRSMMKELRDIAPLGFQAAQGRLKIFEDQRNIRRAGILCEVVLPALSKVFVHCARAEAKHRLGQLAVAVAAYRAKTGQFPAKLESLVPEYISEVPLDPYDDKPLRLRSHPAGVTLYSIAEDLTDDGGNTEFDRGTGKGDILFRVGDVPAAVNK